MSQGAFTSSSIPIGSVGRAPDHPWRDYFIYKRVLQDKGENCGKTYFRSLPAARMASLPLHFLSVCQETHGVGGSEEKKNKCKGYKQHRLSHEE